MGGWKDEFVNLVHRLKAAGHARESASCWGTVLHDQDIQKSRTSGFWATGRERKVMRLKGAWGKEGFGIETSWSVYGMRHVQS